MADFYGDADRSYVLPFIAQDARRVLDIGCGSGWFLSQLKEQRPGLETWGIDRMQVDGVQSERMNVFLDGSFPEVSPDCAFDVVVLNDVLEHMMDPWETLGLVKELLEPGGSIVASIPNVRHYSVVKPLLVSGRWDYQNAGLLDRTHLRFFTFKTARELFTDAGMRLERAELATLSTSGIAARCLALAGPRPGSSVHVTS